MLLAILLGIFVEELSCEWKVEVEGGGGPGAIGGGEGDESSS